MDPVTIAATLIALGVGFGASTYTTKQKLGSAEEEVKKEKEKAKRTAEKLVREAKEESLKIADEARRDEQKRRGEVKNIETRLLERESKLDQKLDELDKRSEKQRKEEAELEEFKNEIREIRKKQHDKLEKIAKLTKADAADKIMKMTEKSISEDLKGLITKLQNNAKEDAEQRAGMIIVQAMERMASDVTAERTTTSLKLPSDDMKGRIIGKEGRNIQSIQKATGVDIMVDDTPGMVVLSSFDPVRREVAKRTMEMLMKDGRIHPGRIEEIVEKAQQEVHKDVIRSGEDAAREIGIVGIPKEVLQLVGELKFRTSYGQNVLKHSTEMAHMAGMLAEELGANVKVAKYAALIHDMGKALTHKMEGKHHHITGEMARKYGVPADVVHAAEAHHDDMEATTVEAVIIRVVDAVSAARPGARNISTENFAERMKDLENTAMSFGGVEKVYAISAGREVRVFVKPTNVDDLGAIKMARDIADKIESTMQYPGTVKINVIRETRAVEFAK